MQKKEKITEYRSIQEDNINSVGSESAISMAISEKTIMLDYGDIVVLDGLKSLVVKNTEPEHETALLAKLSDNYILHSEYDNPESLLYALENYNQYKTIEILKKKL